MKPPCKFCDEPTEADFVAAQSGDQGKTVEWTFACWNHVVGWNDGGDWVAPVYQLVKET